ncbi:protein of unknown function (plasmid) [Cupriavidus taiwanensis]|nr:hypothetical protein CBM2598_U30157 [Cupriavidus taiwanensis]SPD37837.1 protein of unknown function [Cupriavidus taiwanensis]SPD38142.1 protein of unknown function [Cupriavidus taiwanensis]
MERNSSGNIPLYGAIDEHMVTFHGSPDQPFGTDMDEATGRAQIAVDQAKATDAVIGGNVSVDA